MIATLKIRVKNPGELQQVINFIESTQCAESRVLTVDFPPGPALERTAIGLNPLGGGR